MLKYIFIYDIIRVSFFFIKSILKDLVTPYVSLGALHHKRATEISNNSYIILNMNFLADPQTYQNPAKSEQDRSFEIKDRLTGNIFFPHVN